MNCNEIVKQLDDYLDGEASSEQLSVIEQHLESCASCRQIFEDAEQVNQMLPELPVEEPAAGFEQRVFASVRHRYPQVSQHRFKAGFATAIAASLAIWFAASVFVPQATDPVLDVVTIGIQQSQDVKLVFTSVADIQQASMRIELPENVELLGYPGQKMLAWTTRLDKGQNVLTLPVQALGTVEGELVARVNYGDKQKIYRLLIKTANGGALNVLQMDHRSA